MRIVRTSRFVHEISHLRATVAIAADLAVADGVLGVIVRWSMTFDFRFDSDATANVLGPRLATVTAR